MVAFAGERVLELEAPIRNDATKETLMGWGRTQDEVEGGRRRLEPAMVRECFEYLFSKVSQAEYGKKRLVGNKIGLGVDRFNESKASKQLNKQASIPDQDQERNEER